jgi:EAL domain-containing protein (putative c-di-GMP-specific phosphodiesterase class I)/GGDEF domain-containing protein
MDQRGRTAALAVRPGVPIARAVAPRAATFPRCSRGTTLRDVCTGLTDDLIALGFELPSVYLLTGDRLRCHSARGYFQVVDGFSPGTGVIGRAVAEGRSEFIPDVRERDDFIGAVPDLIAEAVAPVCVRGRVVGAVNVESRSVLPSSTPALLDAAADLLGRRIEELGGLPQPSTAQRLAQIAVELTAAASRGELERRAVQAAVELSGMSSAALVHVDAGRVEVRCGVGPLAERLQHLDPVHLQTMAGWVSHVTSSHFPGGEQVGDGYEFLTAAGVRAVSVHPLVVRGQVRGLLVLADQAPVAHAPSMVDVLELLAAHTAAALAVADMLQELAARAELDELTGLGNRACFERALGRALDGAGPGEQVAVLLLDLDDFKHVNDSLGHAAGDRMLIGVAGRLREVLRPQDTVCRLGGDEFVAVCPPSPPKARRPPASGCSAPSRSCRAGTRSGRPPRRASASRWTATRVATPTDCCARPTWRCTWPRGGARGCSRSSSRTCAPRPSSGWSAPASCAAPCRSRPCTWPTSRWSTCAPAGSPPSRRWCAGTTRGWARCRPSEFVALAEQTGDVVALGTWVLHEACAQLLRWDALAGDRSLVLSVNVSTRQLERPGLLEAVDACLASGVEVDRLVLEITETALVVDSATATRTLHELRLRGVRLAVDDFGTGYSSLARLRSAPVSRLKVDRAFVSEIGDDARGAPHDVPVVDATLAMARGLGLGVVAEGVETLAQLDYLRRAQCPEAQGYLLAAPMAPADVVPLLRGQLPWAPLFARPRRP